MLKYTSCAIIDKGSFDKIRRKNFVQIKKKNHNRDPEIASKEKSHNFKYLVCNMVARRTNYVYIYINYFSNTKNPKKPKKKK